MNEVALRKRIAVLVLAALLSVTGATVSAAAVADDAQADSCPTDEPLFEKAQALQ